jgi:sugar phosphate isomerase/epimerase
MKLPSLLHSTRREFVRRSSLALVGIAAGWPGRSPAATPPRRLFSGIGITGPINRAAEFKAAGADYIVPAVADFLMPDRPDKDFALQRDLASASPLPALGCNKFLRDARLRCTGPDADHAAVLAFSAIAFRRLAEVGGKFIGFGSSSARQLPANWPKARADKQFVALLRAMGPLAARHGITISVEQLQESECNYLNHLGQVVEIVAAVGHPNIRVLADLFHIAVMGDTPADLAKAVPFAGLVEIAEKENRTVPGVGGQDFRPYFEALARGGYSGPITIEGEGTSAQLKNAFQTISRQATDVMARL